MNSTRLLAVGGSRRAAVGRFLTNRSGGPGHPGVLCRLPRRRQFVGGQWRVPSRSRMPCFGKAPSCRVMR
jgi:hypothetical protein